MSDFLITQESNAIEVNGHAGEFELLGPELLKKRIVEPEAFKSKKTTVLQLLSGIGEITNREELQAAVEASASAGYLLGIAEAVRKIRKQPYWDGGKAVDEFHAKIIEKLVQSRAQADQKIAAFQRIELAKQRKAEAEAKADQERLVREGQEALAKARKATDEAERNAELAKAKAAREQVKVWAPPPPPPKVAGLTAKPVWVGRVTDAAEAYKVRPEFFELVEKKAVINEAIRGGFRGCPGLIVEETIPVSTR